MHYVCNSAWFFRLCCHSWTHEPNNIQNFIKKPILWVYFFFCWLRNLEICSTPHHYSTHSCMVTWLRMYVSYNFNCIKDTSYLRGKKIQLISQGMCRVIVKGSYMLYFRFPTSTALQLTTTFSNSTFYQLPALYKLGW